MRPSRLVMLPALLVCLAIPALCKGNVVLNISCNQAISQAELIAANRKWTPMRPDPTAFVLNISTSANFAKDVLFGPMFSHPKTGELTFDNSGGANVCEVASNGHPADVVLKDLKKKFANAEVIQPGFAAPNTQPAPQAAPAADAPKAASQPMTNADVLALAKAGLPSDVILAKIRTSSDSFDTGTTALARLKAAGVADSVILAMVEAQSKSSMAAPKQ